MITITIPVMSVMHGLCIFVFAFMGISLILTGPIPPGIFALSVAIIWFLVARGIIGIDLK